MKLANLASHLVWSGHRARQPAGRIPERIKQALEQSHYKVATAARKLGVHRSTLYRYMATYNL